MPDTLDPSPIHMIDNKWKFLDQPDMQLLGADAYFAVQGLGYWV